MLIIHTCYHCLLNSGKIPEILYILAFALDDNYDHFLEFYSFNYYTFI